MRHRRPAAALAALALWVSGPAVLAAPPTFVLHSLVATPWRLPAAGRPFTVFSRITPSEEIGYYALTLAAGQAETLGALVLRGAPAVEVTILAPGGSQFSLPYLPQPQPLWLGGIAVQRPLLYRYTSPVAGTYLLAVQAGTPGRTQPYGLEGNPHGSNLLLAGGFGPGDVLWAPVTWAQSLLWLWA